jgi:hypothetical protein
MKLHNDIARCWDESCPWHLTCRRWTERQEPKDAMLSAVLTMRDSLLKRCEYRIPTEPNT